MVILLRYTSAFNGVIYADFYARILNRNFVSSTKTAEFSSLSSSLWRKLIYVRQRKFSFSSLSTKKNTA